MRSPEADVNRHYLRPRLLDAILAGLEAAGVDAQAPSPADLAPVDQFHHGGIDESLALARLAGFAAQAHVLDIGGGIGGPARLLASRLGCAVTVVDLSAEFCVLGAELTRRTGLAARVRFERASALALPFAGESFDGAWTQHSSMNIADKPRLYGEIRRVLRPGGRLALHEVMAGPRAPLHFPVPWAREPSISFLTWPDQARATITAAGFREIAWHDVTTRTLEWLRRRLAAARGSAGPPPLGTHLLLGPDAPVMFANVVRNVEEGREQIVQAVFERL